MSETTGGYVRDPAAFDARAYAQATERRHADGPKLFQVTAETHPVLHAVFEMISVDNAGQAGHERYSVPLKFRDAVAQAEVVLARLSPEERETVAMGDQDEAAEVLTARTQNAEEKRAIDTLLNAFFDDWHEDQA